MRRCRKIKKFFCIFFLLNCLYGYYFKRKQIKKTDNIHIFHTIIILSDNIKKKLVDKRI